MDGLVHKGLRVALELQAGEDSEGLLGSLESKVSLVQGDILDMLEIGYTINIIRICKLITGVRVFSICPVYT